MVAAFILIHIDSYTNRQTDKCTYIQIHKSIDRQTPRFTNTNPAIHTDTHIYKHRDRQTTLAYKQKTEENTYLQTHRTTNRQTNTHTQTHTYRETNTQTEELIKRF